MKFVPIEETQRKWNFVPLDDATKEQEPTPEELAAASRPYTGSKIATQLAKVSDKLKDNSDAQRSVMNVKNIPTKAPESFVLDQKFIAQVQSQFDAMPPEQRAVALQNLAQRPDLYGEAAKIVKNRYAEFDQAPETLKKAVDFRVENQVSKFTDQGLRPEYAANYAQIQALAGQPTQNFQQMTPDVIGEQVAIAREEQAKKLQDAGFAERVGAGVLSQYQTSGLGLAEAAADLFGNQAASANLRGESRIEAAKAAAIPKSDLTGVQSLQSAMTSLAGQAPFIAMSAITGTAIPVLVQAAVQQFGQSYAEGKQAGLEPGRAALRAVPMAAAEVFFERFGMTKALSGLKDHVAKNGMDSIPAYMAKAIATEIPAELATTATQYGLDVIPGLGIKKNASLVDLFKELEETLRQTVFQAGATAGITTGGAKAYQAARELPYRTPEQKFGRALEMDIENRGFNPDALEQIAIDRLRTTNAISPELTRKPQGAPPVVQPEVQAPVQAAEQPLVQPTAAPDVQLESAKQDPDLVQADEFEKPNLSVTPVTLTSEEAPVEEIKQEEPKKEEKTETGLDLPIVYPLVGSLKISKDVAQFKEGANEKGVVEPLGGTFEGTGVAPIQVWRRLNGDLEVISGRHRLDLAQRSGRVTIPAQIHNEADGFDKRSASILDAELNIRDGQGKVKDYVDYFQGSQISREEADSRGLLARAIGKRSYAIATDGSPTLVTALRGDVVSDEAAYLIAKNYPNNEKLHSVAVKAIQDGKTIGAAVNLMHAVNVLAAESDTTVDLFGQDDSGMREAEDMQKVAGKKQREVAQRLSAITGASKNPALAKAEGIDIKDPDAVKKRINELRQMKSSWEQWATNPEYIAEIRGEINKPLELKGETEADIRAKEAKAKETAAKAKSEAENADADRKAEAERKEIAERSKTAKFDLTPTDQVDKDKQEAIDKKTAEDELAGQGDILSEEKPPKSATAKDLKVGDSVRVGNVAGVIVGVEKGRAGGYVKFHPINSDNPKAYQRIQSATVTFISRPDTDATQAKSEFEGFGEFETELHIDKEEIVQRLGQNMYGASLADIVIKEGLQNSFDAVKAQIYKEHGSLSGKHFGHLEIIVDSQKRTITLKDDGTGMLPSVVDSAFLTIAGSDKAGLPPELSSGGLGMAKMGILMGASRIQLETTKDGKVTTLDTTSEALAAKRFKFGVLPAAKNLHGTTLTLTIPKTFIKDNGDEQEIYFPWSPLYITALNRPLIGPIEVKYTDVSEGTTNIIPIGVKFDVSKYQKVKTVRADWGVINVYFGIERNKSPSHVVLSSGVYQFNGLGKAGSYFQDSNETIPYDIIVNVLPKVKARSAEYPFENSREAFKDRVTPDIQALRAYLSLINRGESAKNLKEGFKDIVSMPRIEVGSELADNSKKLKKAFDKRAQGEVAEFQPLPDEVTIRSGEVINTKGTVIARNEEAEKRAEKENKPTLKADEALPDLATFMADMKANPLQPIFHNNTNVDYLEIGKKFGNPEAFFAELGTLLTEMKETLAKSGLYRYEKLSAKELFFGGISIDRGYGGIHIKVPFNAVLINPFYDWGGKTLFGIRANFYETMTHEIAHMGDMSHGVGHNTEMIKVRQHLADSGMEDYFRDALLDILSRHESTFTAMREAYGNSTTVNTAKSFDEYKENSPAASSGGDSTGTEGESGSVRTGERQGGGENLQAASGAGEQGQVGSGTGGASVKEFPRSGDAVDGLTVREHIPNQSSISASLTDYTVVPGVREIPFSAFDPEYVKSVKLENLDDRTRKLVGEIKASGEINPLIVVRDKEGLYVLEGSHRFDALIALGAKSLPAQVVIDNESMYGDNEQSGFDFTQESDATDKIAAVDPVTSEALHKADQLPTAPKKTISGRSPELSAAAALVKSGQMTAAEFDKLVNKYQPIFLFKEPPVPATTGKMEGALNSAQREKIAPAIPNGTQVGLRLDIPAFRKGVAVVSIHSKGTKSGPGKIIGYNNVASITNAAFGIGNQKASLEIAMGAGKDALHTIEGRYVSITPEQAYTQAQSAIFNPAWTQIGLDPTRHSYFYDRRSTMPVIAAEEILQIGNMVLGKNVTYGSKDTFLYSIEPRIRTKQQSTELNREMRSEKLETYRQLRQQLAVAQKKMRDYGGALETQKLSNILNDFAGEIKSQLGMLSDPSTTPENFLNQARKSFDGDPPFKEEHLSAAVFSVIQAAYQKTPWLLNGLRLSVKKSDSTTRGASAGFLPFARVVGLWTGTSGVTDPKSIRHELAHSMEQMMTPDQRRLIVDEWLKSLDNQIKNNKDPLAQEYFAKVLTYIESPSERTQKEATDALPSYALYQYLTPSEYWAVNAESLLDKQLGGKWAKFVKAIARLFEGLKNVFGFNNKYAVHKVFNDILNGDRRRMSKSMLMDFVNNSGYSTKFLNNIQDEENLIAKHSRPNTPMLDITPVRTAILNGASTAKEVFKAAVRDPIGTAGYAVTGVDRGLLHARNREIWFGSGLNAADFSRYNGELRVSGGLATASVALDNALRGWTMASQVILNGGIEYNTKHLNFTAVKRDKGMAGVYKAEMILKKRLGNQLGTDIVQGYLEAKRSLSILNEVEARQFQVDALLDELSNMPPGTKPDIVEAKRADYEEAVADLKSIQRVERKVSMSQQAIDEFIDMEKKHPELLDIMENWNAVNQNMLGFWRQVGLLSQSRYDLLSGIKDYVPWNRIMEGDATASGFATESTLLSSTKSMTNIGMEKLFKAGKPSVKTEFVAKAGQDTFQINPSAVVGATINDVAVNPNDLVASPNGEVKINAPINEGDVITFTANREIENIIDNMTRSVMRMTMNGLRQYAAMRTVSEYATRNDKNKIRVFPKVDKKEGTFNFISNGRNIVVQIKDPLIADAVYGLNTIDVAMFQPLILTANVLRRAITLSGIFQLKQVFKDAPTAALVTGVKRPDLLIGGVYKGFVTSLLRPMINAVGSKITGRNLDLEPVVELLQAAGIGGFHSPSRTPEAAVKLQLGMMNRNVVSFVLKAMDHVGDASDMAQRVATYKRVLKETGDEAQALYQAANVINFLHRGYGAEAQFLAKTVPFMGAWANASDAIVQALAGGGLKGMSRSKAFGRLAVAGSFLMGTTLLYCMLVGASEDYEELDDQFKMRNYIIPGTKIYLPMNTQAGFLFKGTAEILYNHFIRSSTETPHDATRLRTALREAAVDMLLGPEPLPPIVKTLVEIKFKHDFFTGRSTVPANLENMYAAEQYTAATSEGGKILSSFTGNEKSRLLNPIEADHLIQGLLGTAGSMAMWLSNQIGEAALTRPATPANKVPVIGAFTLPAVGRKNEDLFYDLKERVDMEYKTYQTRLDRMKGDEIAKYKDQQKRLIVLHDYVTKSAHDLGEMEKLIRLVGSGVDIGQTPKEKRETIENLQRAKSKILTKVELFREAAGL